VPVDAVASTELLGDVAGADGLVAKIVAHPATYSCLSAGWAEFTYGQPLDVIRDACVIEQLNEAFRDSGYDVKALVLASTQTDGFMFLAEPEPTP
jgi:hypothetical protein